MNREIILSELKLKGIRSSGAGGQNVNKVATKVELIFELDDSKGLSESEKLRLKTTLTTKLTKENCILMQCDESRSQFRNKSIILKRFIELLTEGLKRPKIRRASRPTRNSVLRRLDNKKSQSQKKANRRKPNF